MVRDALLAVMAVGLVLVAATAARSHPEGRDGVPAMVARVLPAVVSITTRQIERDQFAQPVVTPGLGSGIIVDRRGYILTNHHVIQEVEDIRVALADERTFYERGVLQVMDHPHRRDYAMPAWPVRHDGAPPAPHS